MEYGKRRLPFLGLGKGIRRTSSFLELTIVPMNRTKASPFSNFRLARNRAGHSSPHNEGLFTSIGVRFDWRF